MCRQSHSLSVSDFVRKTKTTIFVFRSLNKPRMTCVKEHSEVEAVVYEPRGIVVLLLWVMAAITLPQG